MQKEPKYEATLIIERKSRIGMLRDIADAFARTDLAILDVKNKIYENSDIGEIIITTCLDGLETLNKVIDKLEAIPGVFSVKEK